MRLCCAVLLLFFWWCAMQYVLYESCKDVIQQTHMHARAFINLASNLKCKLKCFEWLISHYYSSICRSFYSTHTHKRSRFLLIRPLFCIMHNIPFLSLFAFKTRLACAPAWFLYISINLFMFFPLEYNPYFLCVCFFE